MKKVLRAFVRGPQYEPELEVPGLGRIKHPALGATARAYWRKRHRRMVRTWLVVMALIVVSFFVPALSLPALYVSAGYLGYTIGHGRGWDQGFDRGLALPDEAMMEVQTIVASLSDAERAVLAEAIEKQRDDDDGGELGIDA